MFISGGGGGYSVNIWGGYSVYIWGYRVYTLDKMVH